MSVWIIVMLVVGYILGLLQDGIKINIQQLPEMRKPEDDKDYPSFIVGSQEHKDYIAKIRREQGVE